MDFVSSALATWLLEQLADAARGRLATFFLGDEQERALQSAATTAIRLTAIDFFPYDEVQAAQLALIMDQVFTDSVHGTTMAPSGTLLEVLQSGIAAKVAPLGDSDLTELGLSSLDLVGVKLEPLAGTLATHMVRQIAIRGTRGGPLMPLAVQLGQDATHLQGRRIERRLEQLIHIIGREFPQFPLTAGRTALPGQVIVGDIPLEPPGFMARAAIGGLADAASHGQPVVVHALTGLRGVGKTQIAAAYARLRVNEGWELIGWVNAETREGTLTGLARIAGQLGVADPEGDSLESAQRLKDHLNARKTTGLLVFDNATDPDGLRSFLPATGATQVVVTSTNRDFSEFGAAVDVASFSREESLFYLNERTGLADDIGADKVAAELGDLPLGLVQAAAIIRGQRLTYSKYLQRLQGVPVISLLGRVPAGDYPYSAAAALLLSIQVIETGDQSGLVGQLLRVLAVMSPDGVRRDLLYETGTEDDADDMTAIDRALQKCEVGSLLTWSAAGDTVIMHRLLGRVLRERDKASGQWKNTVKSVLSLLEPRLFGEHEAWARREEGAHLIAQIDALWKADSADHRDLELVARQLHARSWAGRQLSAAADVSRAIDYAREALADSEHVLGVHHAETLAAQNNLAVALQSAGQSAEAIALFERTLTGREQILGPDHWDTITSRSGLAEALEWRHLFPEALDLLERNLADCERVYGDDHPNTMSSRHDLAVAYMSAGAVSEAIDLFELTLANREEILGADHPDTFTSRHYLGEAYRRADYPDDEVIILFEHALADRERILGEDHPDTLFSRAELALAYIRTDMPDKAVPLSERALNDHERVIGLDHPRTLQARNNLALAYSRVGRFPEAISLYERTIADHERIIGSGDHHADTLRENLRRAYEASKEAKGQ
jgi:tetratricopeptide (TPR) repeat protein